MHSRGLTFHTQTIVGHHSLDSLQPLQLCAVQTQGVGGDLTETMSKGQALEIRAGLHEIRANGADGQFSDIWELGAFAFERSRNGTPVSRGQQLQRSQVGQPNQDIDEFCHQILWGVIEGQIHGQDPKELRLMSSNRTG